MEHDFLNQLDKDRRIVHGNDAERIPEKQARQSKRRELHCSTFTAAIQAIGITSGVASLSLFPLGIHLPDESEIGSLYVENHSGCLLNVFEGPGGSGRIIGYSTKATYRVVSIADGISSVSLVVDNTQPLADGLVIATLFSHRWAPKMGSIV